jgi:FG-GAP-like repeat
VSNRLVRLINLTLVSSALCSLTIGYASGQTPLALSFSAPINMLVGEGPAGIVAADLNSDGKLDLVTVNSTGSNVSVLLGDGDGTFQAAVNDPVVTSPFTILAGDFDGDGRTDIAVLNWDFSTSPAISVLLGNGDGTFQAGKVTHVLTSQFPPTGFTAGDFNHDGKLDLALGIAGPQAGAFAVAILPGNGDGTFGAPVDSSLTDQPGSIQSADFNGDGKLDLLVTNISTSFSVLLGNGDGTFQAQLNFSPVMAEFSLIGSAAIADFNHDGRLDVVFCGNSTRDLGTSGQR